MVIMFKCQHTHCGTVHVSMGFPSGACHLLKGHEEPGFAAIYKADL